jgi:hypothetical protein
MYRHSLRSPATPPRAPVPASASLAQCIDAAARRCGALFAGHWVHIEVPHGLPDVQVEPLALERVLVDLFQRACARACDECRIDIDAAVHDGWARLVVSSSSCVASVVYANDLGHAQAVVRRAGGSLRVEHHADHHERLVCALPARGNHMPSLAF